MGCPSARCYMQKAALQYAIPCRPPPGYGWRMDATADIAAFERLDIRAGTVVDAQPFPDARKPALKLWIDFGGEIGIRQSSAQVTLHYSPASLLGRQVLALVNLPPRRIAGFESQVLVLGLPDTTGAVVLLRPDQPVPNGGRVF